MGTMGRGWSGDAGLEHDNWCKLTGFGQPQKPRRKWEATGDSDLQRKGWAQQGSLQENREWEWEADKE